MPKSPKTPKTPKKASAGAAPSAKPKPESKAKAPARAGTRSAWAAPKPSAADKRHAAEIVKRLRKHYAGELKSALNSNSPYELLVATILSAQCTDARVNLVTPDLFAEFPDAKALAKADPERLKELIRSTGFFNNKAKSLFGMAEIVADEHGGEIPGSMEELSKLPGVGRKTAWCVLGAYFGQQGIVVDTHLKRVAGRLGMHEETDPVKIELTLNELVPEKSRGDFTHGITRHGRAVCVARKPKCGECFLADLCPSVDPAAVA